MEVLREFIQRNTLEEEEKEGETSEEKGAINKMFDSHKIDARQKRILEYVKRSKDAVLTWVEALRTRGSVVSSSSKSFNPGEYCIFTSLYIFQDSFLFCINFVAIKHLVYCPLFYSF